MAPATIAVVCSPLEEGMESMKKRPVLIWIVAVGLIVSPLFYYFQHALHHSLPLGDVWATGSSIHPAKLVAVALGPIVGLLLLQIRPISWFAILGYCIYTIAVNIYFYANARMGTAQALVFSSTGLVGLAFFLRKSIYAPYFNPKLGQGTWVRAHDRVQFVLEVELENRPSLACTTFDISEAGCFLATEDRFVLGERLDMKIRLLDDAFPISGTVVWISDGTTKPRGVGVKFERTTAAFGQAVADLRGRIRQTKSMPAASAA